MNIAIICARKNSKRIKNKNFLKVGGKPLIDYTIDAAIESKIFDSIIVNTDNKKYKYKKQCCKFISQTFEFGRHKIRVLDVLKEMLKTLNLDSDANIFILFPTCPLRNSTDIKSLFNI